MELPRYEKTFNKEARIDKLSDSSFETNANSLLEGYFRFLPSLKAHLANIDNLTPSELIAYNDSVAKILYGPRISDLFKNNQQKEIIDLSEITKQRLLQPKEEILDSINFNNLALLLIRPEARFLTNDIKLFLQEIGYNEVSEHESAVNLQQYWIMYNDGFMKSNLLDFPTRTLIYTHGESKILILYKKQQNPQHYLSLELKGLAGIPSNRPTLRGTVILNGFEKAKKENSDLFYDSIDPLGMYRAITSGKIHSPDQYSKCIDPVLYYAGQGIHIPENYELKNNIGALLDKRQLEDLSTKFKKS